MEILVGVFTIAGVIVGWLMSLIKLRIERKDKFRLAALDKRLEAHQKAYAQCSRFWDVIDSNSREEIRNVIKEGNELMANYSLYLENGTRKKMVEVLGFFNAYCPREEFISKFVPNERTKAYNTYLKEVQKLHELGKLIQLEVALEPISINEIKIVEGK